MINNQAIINHTNYCYQYESNRRGDKITSKSAILFVNSVILTWYKNSKSPCNM